MERQIKNLKTLMDLVLWFLHVVSDQQLKKISGKRMNKKHIVVKAAVEARG
jgi:hypothetical protein